MVRKKGLSRVRSQHQQIVEKLRAFSEYELTTTVLIPLLQALGYERVEYHGGSNEGGKDIICWGKDRIGDIELVVAQVKRYKPSARAADKRSFSELVTQLSQADEKPVPNLDGLLISPSKVYFFTPFPVDTRALETRFEKYSSLNAKNLKIVDGPKLASLISSHLPKLAQQISGRKKEIHAAVVSQLNNKILLNALDFKGAIEISRIYTDLNFKMDQVLPALFFRILRPMRKECRLNYNQYLAVKRISRELKRLTGIEIKESSPTKAKEAQIKQTIERIAGARAFCEAILRHIEDKEAKHRKQFSDSKSSISRFNRRKIKAGLKDIALQFAKEDEIRNHVCVKALTNLAENSVSTPVELEQQILKIRESLNGSDFLKPPTGQTRRDLPLMDKQLCEISEIRKLLIECCQHSLGDIRNAKAKLLRKHANQVKDYKYTMSYLVRNDAYPSSESMIFLSDKAREHLRLIGIKSPKKQDEILSGPDVYRLFEESINPAKDLNDLLKHVKGFLERNPEPRFEVVLDGRKFTNLIRELKESLKRQLIGLGETARPGIDQIRRLIAESNEAFVLGAVISESAHITETLGPGERESDPFMNMSTRVSIPITRVFQSGENLAVLGEAGAGKTTTLQIYAYRLLKKMNDAKLVLYAPLAQLVQEWTNWSSRDFEDNKEGSIYAESPDLEFGLACYLRSLGIQVSGEQLSELLEEKDAVVLLDGIDEAFRNFKVLMSAMKRFADNFPKSQVVTSSRISGDYLDLIPFVRIGLLPFTARQRRRFFQSWFRAKDTAHCEEILAHLRRHPDLATVVRNPLSATILCVLAEHDVPLPETEVRLYHERMRLYLGQYDIHKRVQRLLSTRHDLSLLARKLAFCLHERHQREASVDDLYSLAEKLVPKSMKRESVKKGIEELIFPCNLLVPMAPGKFGFGHLKFQEFLVATEIRNNRSISLLSLLQDDWWRGAFVLYSELEDIEWLISWLTGGGYLPLVEKTLRAMIKVRPDEEMRRLSMLIDENIRLDESILCEEAYEFLERLDPFDEYEFMEDKRDWLYEE